MRAAASLLPDGFAFPEEGAELIGEPIALLMSAKSLAWRCGTGVACLGMVAVVTRESEVGA